MNCDQVKPLLSAFHDGELSSDQCAMVADHVSSCDDCAARVMSFQSLSALVQRSTTRPPAAELLEKVQAAISVDRALVNRTASFSYRRNVIAAILATAAAFTGIIVWQFAGRPSHDHGEMAAAFGDFLDAYSEGKNDAPEILVGHFQGKPIDVQNASLVLKHEPLAGPTLLAKHEVANRYLLRMPDCDCIETIYSCDGKTSLVLLEHEKEHAEWFGKRPMARTECAGKPCCLVELNGSLVATWQIDGKYVTAVGLRDKLQLEELMNELGKS